MNSEIVTLNVTVEQLEELIEALKKKRTRTHRTENLQQFLEYQLKLYEPTKPEEIDVDSIPF